MRIEILLATYQGDRYIRELLNSILAQAETNWSLIISDDNSTDGTMEILREYEMAFEERIRVQANEGARGAKENFGGLLEGNGGADYIFFADQDDVWYPDKMSRLLRELRHLEATYGPRTPILVHSDLRLIDGYGRELFPSMNATQKLEAGTRRELRHLLVQNNVTGCAMAINRSLRELALPVPSEAIMHDWWLALVASAFGIVSFIPEALVGYRQHSGNVIGAKHYSLGNVVKQIGARRQVRESLRATRCQANELVSRYGNELSDAQRDLVWTFATLGEHGFLERRRRIAAYRLWKAGCARNLGLLFYA